jgi:hypothetical protein
VTWEKDDMTIEALLRSAFQDGCGESLPEPTSPVQPVTARQALPYWKLSEFLADTSRWGQPLLSPEIYPDSHFTQETHWMAQLGKTLVRQASPFIPASFLHAAGQWAQLSPFEQRTLVRRVFQWIAKSYVGEVRRLTMEEMQEEARRTLRGGCAGGV